MKLSNLIAALQIEYQEVGDVDVYICNGPNGDDADKITSIYNCLLDQGENSDIVVIETNIPTHR